MADFVAAVKLRVEREFDRSAHRERRRASVGSDLGARHTHTLKEKSGRRCFIMFRRKAAQVGGEIVQPKSSQALAERELLDRNRSYYDMLW